MRCLQSHHTGYLQEETMRTRITLAVIGALTAAGIALGASGAAGGSVSATHLYGHPQVVAAAPQTHLYG